MDGFLFQAMIYMAAAVVCVPIAKKIGLGSVLGYLLAGALIGPYIIGFVGEEGHDIMHFAEFGVVMMLFLVGLELEPPKLWAMRRQILGLGMSQLVGTVLVILSIALLFDIQWQSALAAAMALAMSSTAIVLQTCKERGQLSTSLGKNSFSVLLFQDLSIIPILALLPLLVFTGDAIIAKQNFLDGYPHWLKALVILAAINIVVVIGRFVVVPLLGIIARTKLRELFIAASLLLVVSIAYLMQYVGLSPALGTFLAGVVLANSEFKYELESNLDPFKSLLLGLFFMAVGASFNFQLIIDKPFLIASLTFAVVLIKFSVLFIIGKIVGFSNRENFSFSFILSQVGEFAFVILSIIAQLKILSNEHSDIMIAVTASSMILTPILLLFNDKLIQSRFKAKIQEQEQEADEVDDFNEVIIAGFSHFGSTLGRFLKAGGVEATYIDSDLRRVNLLRKIGFKVYFGDATRKDFLESAGAEQAKIIIIAISDVNITCEVIKTVQQHFPNLEIMARAKNRVDAYKILEYNVTDIYRDYLETSIKLGVDTLVKLGHRAYTATRSGRKFIQYDESDLRELYELHTDEKAYINLTNQKIRYQEEVLKSDTEHQPNLNDYAWDKDDEH